MSSLERLWAGWRHSYIEGITGQSGSPGECVFCAILDSGLPDEDTYILWRDPDGLAFAILNAYPYGSGHLMVMPVRHTASPEDLDPAESAAVWRGVADAVTALRAAYRSE